MRLVLSIALSLLFTTGSFAANATQVTIVGATGGAAVVSGGALNVNATVSPSGTQNVNVTQINGTTTATGNGTTNAGTQRVTISSDSTVPLPTGAATSANQEVTAAGVSATSAQGVQGVAGGVALPVSAASLPLPALAATSTKQSDGTQKSQIVDGSGNVIAATSNALNVNDTQATASNLNAQIVGNAASGAADSGNPAKVGCKVNAVLPTFIDGNRADCQETTSGKLYVSPGVTGAVTDGGANTAMVMYGTGTALGALSVYPDSFNGSTWDRQFTCPLTAAVSVTAAATTQIVALSGTTVTRVCSVSLGISLTGTVNVVTGTGTNCGTPTTISNAIPLTTGQMWQQSAAAGGSLFRSTAGGEICIAATVGTVTGFITYAQF